MLRLMYSIFKDYGLDAVQLGIIGFFGWKLFTNHLKHIQDKIDKLCERFGIIETKVNEQSNRISKLEGKLDQ